MNLQQRDEGDFRIYTGAVEAPRGDGYIAALVVSRIRGERQGPLEAFRDESLACGYRWPSAGAALAYALSKAREVIRAEQHRAAC